MPKTFFTEHEIDALHQRGVTTLDVSDNVVLTDLALERALKLGIPIRRVQTPVVPAVAASASADLHSRVRAAVLARLSQPVDSALVEAVIARVLSALK